MKQQTKGVAVVRSFSGIGIKPTTGTPGPGHEGTDYNAVGQYEISIQTDSVFVAPRSIISTASAQSVCFLKEVLFTLSELSPTEVDGVTV